MVWCIKHSLCVSTGYLNVKCQSLGRVICAIYNLMYIGSWWYVEWTNLVVYLCVPYKFCANVISFLWMHLSKQMYQKVFFSVFFSNVMYFQLLISGLSRVVFHCCWHSYPKNYLSITDLTQLVSVINWLLLFYLASCWSHTHYLLIQCCPEMSQGLYFSKVVIWSKTFYLNLLNLFEHNLFK